MTAPRKNWLEWSVFALGLVLLIGTVGYLGYEASVHGRKPAALSVTLGEPWSPDSNPASVVVPVTVHNEGGHTAVDVTVEVALTDPRASEPGERRQLGFAFVPRHSSRSGALVFEQRPPPGALRAQVLGYLEP